MAALSVSQNLNHTQPPSSSIRFDPVLPVTWFQYHPVSRIRFTPGPPANFRKTIPSIISTPNVPSAPSGPT